MMSSRWERAMLLGAAACAARRVLYVARLGAERTPPTRFALVAP